MIRPPRIYIASSFRHVHAVRLLSRELAALGFELLDWTLKATPPEGLNPSQRREWMDTDHGGEVFVFCAEACKKADFLIYLGGAGQDAGVEVGMAYGAGVPVLGIKGPLEAPGLMLYGAASVWVERVEEALDLLAAVSHTCKQAVFQLPGHGPIALLLGRYAYRLQLERCHAS